MEKNSKYNIFGTDKKDKEQFKTNHGAKQRVTKSSVSMWEDSNVVPREEVLRKIAV
ncbi:hypothetical protein ACI1UG_10535 [Lactococcus garvieae]|uniref:hypothetical protein n=1 Tax=Lactococcus garvieae TaxID=1363 RepID=UPI0038548B0C